MGEEQFSYTKYTINKRRAVIWLLKKLCRPPGVKVTAEIENGKRTEINMRGYDWRKLTALMGEWTSEKKLTEQQYRLDRELLRDACDLLFFRKQIDLRDNEKNQFDIEISATREGELALREDVYQEEIANFTSDRIFRNFRWWIPFAAFILALTSLVITTCKKSVILIQIPKETVDSTRNEPYHLH
jgi:hypothetical protein